MNTIEANLGQLLDRDADDAPHINDLGARVVARARRVRRRRLVALGGVAVSFVLVVGIGTVSGGTLFDGDTAETPVAAANSRPLQATGMVDCQPPQSGTDIAKRDFAFDGTVAKIGTPSAPDASLARYSSVTFTVNEWFKGGKGRTATITMTAPMTAGEINGEAGPSYQAGTRLLVSGDGSQEVFLRASGCGYTRYFDSASASYWRSATR